MEPSAANPWKRERQAAKSQRRAISSTAMKPVFWRSSAQDCRGPRSAASGPPKRGGEDLALAAFFARGGGLGGGAFGGGRVGGVGLSGPRRGARGGGGA